MTGLAELGEISKGAWGNRYQSYGQDDMRNYNQGRVVAGAGAGTLAGAGLYAAHATKKLGDTKHYESPKYARKIGRAKTAGKVGLGLLAAAPVVGAANWGRQRLNTMRNGQTNL